MFERLAAWLHSLFNRCDHVWEARFKWEDQWAIYYDQCIYCDEERY